MQYLLYYIDIQSVTLWVCFSNANSGIICLLQGNAWILHRVSLVQMYLPAALKRLRRRQEAARVPAYWHIPNPCQHSRCAKITRLFCLANISVSFFGFLTYWVICKNDAKTSLRFAGIVKILLLRLCSCKIQVKQRYPVPTRCSCWYCPLCRLHPIPRLWAGWDTLTSWFTR